MPVNSGHKVELAVNAVMIVKCARLDMTTDHQIEGGEGRTALILDPEVVTAQFGNFLFEFLLFLCLLLFQRFFTNLESFILSIELWLHKIEATILLLV